MIKGPPRAYSDRCTLTFFINRWGKCLTSLGMCGMLFFVMGMMKDQYIDYLNKVEENLRDMQANMQQTRMLVRELKQHDFVAESQCEEVYEADDFVSPTHEDCGYFGYEGLCED